MLNKRDDKAFFVIIILQMYASKSGSYSESTDANIMY